MGSSALCRGEGTHPKNQHDTHSLSPQPGAQPKHHQAALESPHVSQFQSPAGHPGTQRGLSTSPHMSCGPGARDTGAVPSQFPSWSCYTGLVASLWKPNGFLARSARRVFHRWNEHLQVFKKDGQRLKYSSRAASSFGTIFLTPSSSLQHIFAGIQYLI